MASFFVQLEEFSRQGKLFLCSAATESEAKERRTSEESISMVEQLCGCVACITERSWRCGSLRGGEWLPGVGFGFSEQVSN